MFSRLARLLSSHYRIAFFGAVLVACALGVVNAWPHMREPLWQDEASTLVTHASRGIIHPFLHYFSANNHVGFTAMLAAWLQVVPEHPEPFLLRLLPFGLFLLAIPATVLAGWRLAGPTTGLLAGLFFAGSSVSGNFATQIRGYAPSWIFIALALVFGLEALRSRRPQRWFAAFFVASTASVAILPTNMLLVGIVGVALVLSDCAVHGKPEPRRLVGYLALLGSPVIGLLVTYASVWQELVSFGKANLSQWSRPDLLASWLRGALWDWPWLAPLVGAGIGLKVGRLWSSPREADGVSRLTFVVSVVAGLVAVIWLMPRTPFPRTLVPLLPAWYVAVAAACSFIFEYRIGRHHLPWLAAGLAALSVPLVLNPSISRCDQSRPGAGAQDCDLCYQYFRDHYNPGPVLDAWAAAGGSVPIVTDFEGAFALQALRTPARVYPYKFIPVRLEVAPMLVAHDDAAASMMAASLGAPPGTYVRIADTGYFKLYAVARRVRGPPAL